MIDIAAGIVAVLVLLAFAIIGGAVWEVLTDEGDFLGKDDDDSVLDFDDLHSNGVPRSCSIPPKGKKSP